jgi:hypothetical protein
MPNITVFIPTEKMPSDVQLAKLSEQCTDLCTGLLQATLTNVHIIFVGVRPGRGHPVFAEIQFRQTPFRTPSVMDQFMAALEITINQCTDLTARIRCFGYDASSIYARN